MTWTSIDTLPAGGSWNFVLIKEALKAAGWTVPESSDGTTYDNTGDVITHGLSGAGGLDNTRAWFRIVSPAGAPEFTVQRTTFGSSLRIKMGRAAFNAGSPGVLETPTTTVATNEIVLLGSGTDAAPTGSSWGTVGALSQILKGSVDDAAPYGFWFSSSNADGLSPDGNPAQFILDPLNGTITGDGFTYWVMCRNADLNTSQMSISDTPVGQYTYLASATPSVAVQMPALNLVYANGTLVVPNNVFNTGDEGLARLFPIIYARRSAVANPGFKGFSSIMRWVAPSMRRWTPLSVAAPLDWIVVGNVALPWDGTPPRF